MKKIILLILLTSSFYTFSQKKKSNFIQPFPVFEECKNNAIKEKCFNNVISSEIIKSIEVDVFNYLKRNEKENSVNVYVNFIIDQYGKPIQQTINTTKVKSNDSVAIKLKEVVKNLPKISPRKNEFNHPILTYYNLSLKLGWNENRNKIVLLEKTNEPIPFKENSIFTAPIYPGCTSKTNKGLKQCLSNQITKLIIKKYKYKKAIKGFNKKGTFFTYVLFKVDKEGEVNSYKSYGQNINFENEAIKSLKKIKNLVPGKRKGKPVNVHYAIPIKLVLE